MRGPGGPSSGEVKVVVSFDGARFVARCTFNDRLLPKEAGFRWDPVAKQWFTTSPGVASRLVQFADEGAKKRLHRTTLVRTNWTGAIPHPGGLTPLPFQKDIAVPFALERNRSYLALDPGLGKTICAAIIRNALGLPMVYVCPPFLMANVESELDKWCTMPRSVWRLGTQNETTDILMVPDSLLSRGETELAIQDFTEGRECLLVVDEAHRFKNDTAERSRALYGRILPRFARVVFLSGTPMPNRPMELYPVLKNCAPELIGFMNKFEFGRRYCAGFRSQWGWDFTGASNVEELAGKIMGKFMLRLKKRDVLPELPAKTEEVVIIDEELPPVLADLTKQILARYSPEDLMAGKIGEEHVSSYRRKLGLAKVAPAAQFVKFVLEQGTEAVLLFCIHREVIAQLAHALREFDPQVIHGGVEKDERFAIATEFQNNPARRVLILNIAAGGVGFNLTKATRVVFAEFAWTPGDNDQAVDRAHRIGQDSKVLAQYLVHRNSLDRDVMEVVLKKRGYIKHV